MLFHSVVFSVNSKCLFRTDTHCWIRACAYAADWMTDHKQSTTYIEPNKSQQIILTKFSNFILCTTFWRCSYFFGCKNLYQFSFLLKTLSSRIWIYRYLRKTWVYRSLFMCPAVSSKRIPLLFVHFEIEHQQVLVDNHSTHVRHRVNTSLCIACCSVCV